ncbi:type 2 phosphatidylinositol 4,5-bisphosphate 4-phosphatase-like [Hydractinia symbiolongicarpus]|uniref:type 2 phosphatidylinositol 4,5-bisphosphate 4-phosphatase-like n=1 Tax=Hydractinia symbiolongicarpus TaxID=13093 RepID=UPI00254A39F7|nr:type 2 phosphatidylinositol 4,5-bisphosphate 4-phosphatase-like [Hydractinia symbiolongicarpus]
MANPDDTQPLLDPPETFDASSPQSEVADNNSLVNDDVQDGSLSGSPPPPYGDAPPPYSGSYNPAVQPPPAGVMGEPTVVCRVCQQLVFIRGREGQRVVKCSNCHEATPIKAPPAGKKYIRCPCNALLTCRATSTRISCPRANCKRVINVGGGPPASAPVPNVQPGDARIRVTCGHCNETFVFRTTAHLARCPYCRKVSSVGPQFAKNRALACAIAGVLFLAMGVGVTVGTLELAKQSGGIYVLWIGAFISGLLFLIRSCYYCTMTISQIEGQS